MIATRIEAIHSTYIGPIKRINCHSIFYSAGECVCHGFLTIQAFYMLCLLYDSDGLLKDSWIELVEGLHICIDYLLQHRRVCLPWFPDYTSLLHALPTV